MLSDEFILGLISGEGSFHIVLESSSRQRPKFTMNMHEDEILDEICEYLGVGTISKPDDIRVEWQVQSKADVKKLKQWVDKNMCSSFKHTDKYRQFKLWSEAVEIIPDDRTPIQESKRVKLVELAYAIPKSNTRTKSKSWWINKVSGNQVFFCGEETDDGSDCDNRVGSKEETCRWH